jgi:hypothetical protein
MTRKCRMGDLADIVCQIGGQSKSPDTVWNIRSSGEMSDTVWQIRRKIADIVCEILASALNYLCPHLSEAYHNKRIYFVSVAMHFKEKIITAQRAIRTRRKEKKANG